MNVRPATRGDLARIAALFGAAEEAVLGRPSRLDAIAVEGWLQTVSFETNTWLLEEDDGTLSAAGFAQLHGERGACAGAVRPDAQGRGLGARLVELTESRLVEEGAARIHAWTVARDERAERLLGARGYREARRFWDMAIDLDAAGEEGEPSEPSVAVEGFREEDARAFHAALEESFEDHWEAEPESFEEFWVRQRARSNYDPSLWFVTRVGGEVAGIARNEARPPDGYVGALGVRPPWRGRGHGRALLLHSFREFRRRGLRRATLGVDAANATGATRLYESVGMHVEQENVVWEKVVA